MHDVPHGVATRDTLECEGPFSRLDNIGHEAMCRKCAPDMTVDVCFLRCLLAGKTVRVVLDTFTLCQARGYRERENPP